MNQTVFAHAEEFIWKNARLLERQLFAYHFYNGPPEAVIQALCAYQNADGGFGHALEPDIRCPHSQPVPVQHALEILDAIGFEAAIVQHACDYLVRISTPAGGVPWLLPIAHGYPRAPWWNTVAEPAASLNPTAAIAGLLHKNKVQHDWLAGATGYCWESIANLQPTDQHEMGVTLTFLYYVPDRQRAEQELERLAGPLFSSGLVADVNATGYVRKPLDWAPTPQHALRKYFREAEIRANLAKLIDEQQADGGWNITWPALSPGCELEWRGWVTLANLLTLRANGHFESA